MIMEKCPEYNARVKCHDTNCWSFYYCKEEDCDWQRMVDWKNS